MYQLEYKMCLNAVNIYEEYVMKEKHNIYRTNYFNAIVLTLELK
jgi:hypothetical protein